MEREDYWLLHKGYYNKILNEKRTLRWAVMPIVQVLATKKVNPFQVLPLPGDDELRKQIAHTERVEREFNIEKAKQVLERINAAKKEGRKSGVSITDKLEMIRVLKNEHERTNRS